MIFQVLCFSILLFGASTSCVSIPTAQTSEDTLKFSFNALPRESYIQANTSNNRSTSQTRTTLQPSAEILDSIQPTERSEHTKYLKTTDANYFAITSVDLSFIMSKIPGSYQQSAASVQYTTNLTISEVQRDSIDTDGNAVIIKTIAETLNFPTSAISVLGHILVPSNARRNLRSQNNVKEALATPPNTFITMLRTNISLSQTQYTSSDVLYSNSTATLDRQVSNGQFTANLQNNANEDGVTYLSNATVTRTTSSLPSAGTKTGAGGGGALPVSKDSAAGIFAVGLFLVLVLGYFCAEWYAVSSIVVVPYP